jgi:hypothetical protein
MRRPTERDAAILDKFRKESEFVKPYTSDSYEEMEYGFIEPWDFGQWNDLSFPDVKWATPILEPWKLPPIDPDDPKGKCHIILACIHEVCYCPGGEKCFLIKCTHRVVSMQLKKFIGSGIPAGFSITKGAGNEVCITAPAGAHETMDIRYLLEYVCDGKKFYEWVPSQAWVDACNESECCDDTGLAWDDPTSADTVARNANCTVAILDTLGKGGPYTWAVSGTGFTLTNATTVGLSNTLNADASACGTATVTVTGCNGATVTGYVRCTTGVWTVVSTCGTPLGGCNMYYCTCTWYEGKDRHIVRYCLFDPGYTCSGCAKIGVCTAYANGPYCTTANYCAYHQISEWTCT